MTVTRSTVAQILNEASLLGVAVDVELAAAFIRLDVLSLEPGDDRSGRELEVRLGGVTRIAASLRAGHWADQNAPVQTFALEELTSVVDSFGHLPVYGDDFIDSTDTWLKIWGKKLSLDWSAGSSAGLQTFELFQEGHNRHLDLRFWFTDLSMLNTQGLEEPLEGLAAAADRWWSAMREGDSRTASSGIFPLKSD